MKIIKRTSDNVVLFAHPDLVLDSDGAYRNGWHARFVNSSNASIETIDNLPDDFVNGGWTYINGIWATNSIGDEYIAAKNAVPVPEVVTMVQARLALLDASLISLVDTFIETQSEESKIYWNKSLEVRRDHPLVATVQTALSLTDSQINDLFINASQKT